MSQAKTNAINIEFQRLIGANHLRQDILNQVGKWEKAADFVVTQTDTVYERVKGLIAQAKREKELREQQQMDMAMLALSLAMVGPLGFVGGIVQYKVAPRVFAAAQRKMDRDTVKIAIQHFGGKQFKESYLGKLAAATAKLSDENKKALAKGASGIVQDVAETAATAAVEPNKASSKGLDTEAPVATIEELRSAMKEKIRKMHRRAGNAVSALSTEFELTNTARDILQHANGRLEKAKADLKFYINAQRDVWKREWTFYGTDPKLPKKGIVQNQIERNVWSLWLPATGIKIRRRTGELVPSEILPQSISRRFETLGIWTHAPAVYNHFGHRIPLRIEGDIDSFIEWISAVRWAYGYRPKPLDMGKWGTQERSLPDLDRIGR